MGGWGIGFFFLIFFSVGVVGLGVDFECVECDEFGGLVVFLMWKG